MDIDKFRRENPGYASTRLGVISGSGAIVEFTSLPYLGPDGQGPFIMARTIGLEGWGNGYTTEQVKPVAWTADQEQAYRGFANGKPQSLHSPHPIIKRSFMSV